MDPASELQVLMAWIRALEAQLVTLDDRIKVLEEQTIDHENRLQDLESKRDDDAYLGSN